MLYNLVLVDDEDWILSGIQNAIEWEEVGFRVTGAFHNGREALAHVLHYHTDAMLTDIKMPIQDGISLVKEIREAGFTELEVVFLSGYDDFLLAQSSLRLGAVDYILKPSAPEQIVEVFSKIKTRLDEKRRAAEEKKVTAELAQAGINVLKDVICNSITGENEARYEKFMSLYSEFVETEKGKNFVTVSLALKETVKESRPSISSVEQIKALKNMAEECQESPGRPYLIKNQFSFSLVFSDCAKDELDSCIEDICRRLRRESGKSPSLRSGEWPGGSLISAKSEGYTDFGMVRKSYEASLDKLFGLKMPIDMMQLYLKLGNDTVLKAAIGDRDQQIVLWSLKNWLIKIDEAEPNHQNRLVRRLIYSLSIFFLQNGVPEHAIGRLYEIVDGGDYGKIKEAIISFVKSELMTVPNSNTKNAHLCKEVAKYISNNYTDEITLNELSGRFYISPNYLGTLFKKNMEMGIREYQTTIRLDQADALIASGKFKLYQVAQMVGYPNYEYFRKIYCKYKGKNPSEQA